VAQQTQTGLPAADYGLATQRIADRRHWQVLTDLRHHATQMQQQGGWQDSPRCLRHAFFRL
jgi:hypothetical protein